MLENGPKIPGEELLSANSISRLYIEGETRKILCLCENKVGHKGCARFSKIRVSSVSPNRYVVKWRTERRFKFRSAQSIRRSLKIPMFMRIVEFRKPHTGVFCYAHARDTKNYANVKKNRVTHACARKIVVCGMWNAKSSMNNERRECVYSTVLKCQSQSATDTVFFDTLLSQQLNCPVSSQSTGRYIPRRK